MHNLWNFILSKDLHRLSSHTLQWMSLQHWLDTTVNTTYCTVHNILTTTSSTLVLKTLFGWHLMKQGQDWVSISGVLITIHNRWAYTKALWRGAHRPFALYHRCSLVYFKCKSLSCCKKLFNFKIKLIYYLRRHETKPLL